MFSTAGGLRLRLCRLSGNGRAVPVPVHGAKDIGPGLLAAIARQTGVDLK
ncbi:MAG: type II toxin-antitoxin system HicA family toxin [Desulfovibrionaceae bacterium]|nr:type II toxin-antitoxin system HicA family toxin [Desulfovibrionaceae bacterium]